MIKIFTFHFNNPDFLEKQYHSFKKHLKEPHELICINNASGEIYKSVILEKCVSLGIKSYVPQDVNHKQAGWSHQTALNDVWSNLVAHATETVIIIDHDIFPIKEVRLYKEYDVAAIMQGRGNYIKYFHPGFIIIHPSLNDRDQIDFTGEEIDGYRCDTGGNIYRYLQQHPDLKIKELSMVDIEDSNLGDDKLQLCEDFILHYRNGSNWANTPNEIIKNKLEKLDFLLES